MTENITEEKIYSSLQKVYDPEIPVSVVDLGLIYDVKIFENWVGVKMTLTTPGCGMSTYIANQVKEAILKINGVNECDVKIVWEPKWSPEKMSNEARKKLGM